jgi:two-component system, NarL family, response regulator
VRNLNEQRRPEQQLAAASLSDEPCGDYPAMKSARLTDQITVVVADDHPVTREGLVKILESEKDIKIVAEAEDGEEVCALYDQFLPDVLILDLRLRKKDGIQILHELMSRSLSKPRVIIMTCYDSEHDICQALRAGVKAFLTKVAGPQQIREAVRFVADGETYFPPEVLSKVAESFSQPELSKREIEVLEKMARGKSNKEIGSALYISEGTVKYHVKFILQKLDAVGRAEAIAIAAKRGLLQVG